MSESLNHSFRTPLLVSTNSTKIEEFRALLGELEVSDIDIPEVQSVDSLAVVQHKLNHLITLGYAGPVVVEDTALHFHAWNGLPGALVKWFVLNMTLDALFHAFSNDNTMEADAVSTVGLLADGEAHCWRGELRGTIVRPRGRLGGWTPLFEVAGRGRTLAEMDLNERLAVTMRGKPLEQLMAWLKRNGAG